MALVETTALYKAKQSTDSESRSLTAAGFFHIKERASWPGLKIYSDERLFRPVQSLK